MPEVPTRQAPEPSGAERRTTPRKRLEGELSLVDLGAENGGLLLDLSEGGLMLQAIFPVAPQPEIPVIFELPNTNQRVNARAEIAWTTNKQAGLRFTDIPDSAREQIRKWLNTEAHFAAPFPQTITDATQVYSDFPVAMLSDLNAGQAAAVAETAEAEQTVRYLPDFAKNRETRGLEELLAEKIRVAATGMDSSPQAVSEVASEVAAAAAGLTPEQVFSALKTVRYVPDSMQAPAPQASATPPLAAPAAAAPPVAMPEISLSESAPAEVELSAADFENLPEVRPVEEETVRVDPSDSMVATNAPTQWQEMCALVGQPMTAQLSEALAAMWRTPGFLERLRAMSAAGRRRMLQELDFQSRAFSRWLLEMESGATPHRTASAIETRRAGLRR